MNLATQVGRPYDAATVARDLRTLWSGGRFRDVQVETRESDAGADVIFRVTPEPQYPLREVRLRPHTFGLQISLPAGTLVTELRAHDLALAAQRQLNERGYAHAKVNAALASAPGGKADVLLDVTPGEALRLKPLGDPSLKAPKWYSAAAVDAHAARLRSLWITRGYFDARITAGEELGAKEAVVDFHVEPGPYYHPLDMKALCSCLFAERRESERRGVLDFQPSVDESGAWSIERGRPYTVGRIRFTGHHHYSDGVIRSQFLLDEGVPLDSWRLRQSVVRLNRSGMFEPLDEHQVHIETNAATGVADITVNLTERKRGAWNFSGPLPISGSVSARISTYTVSLNLIAYSSILKLATNRSFLPVLALERPYSPGLGWRSGFYIAPQLPPYWMALNYVATQLEQRLTPLLAGTRVPDLTVTMQRPGGDAAILCEAPKPRLHAVRSGALLGLHFLRAVTN